MKIRVTYLGIVLREHGSFCLAKDVSFGRVMGSGGRVVILDYEKQQQQKPRKKRNSILKNESFKDSFKTLLEIHSLSSELRMLLCVELQLYYSGMLLSEWISAGCFSLFSSTICLLADLLLVCIHQVDKEKIYK